MQKVCNCCGFEKPLDEFPTQMKRGQLVHIGDCRACKNEKQRQTYHTNADDRKEKMRQYHAENREANNERSRDYYHANKDKAQAYREENKEHIAQQDWERGIQRRYGVTPDQYEQMVIEQNCQCAICGRKEPGGSGVRWHIDHCHITGRVRGLLCTLCNVGIGRLQEDPILPRAAANYLELHMS